MAGAKPGVHALQLKPPVVHEALKKGGKFVKWDEDPCNGPPTLVTLKVDEDGFFLTWSGGSTLDLEILDISTIRDTRIGKYAKHPKDPRVRELLGLGKVSNAEDKLISIVYGNDLVNISFLNYQAMEEDEAKLWTDELFTLATNILSQNASRTTFLRKAYTKLKLQAMQEGRINLRNVAKMFSDKKRVELALENSGLKNNDKKQQNEGITQDEFTWEAFQGFLDSLCRRPEIQSILEECGSKKKPFISLDQLTDFINHKQRDSRLNEVLYPPLKKEQVRLMMEKYEKNSQLEREQISLQGFSRYLEGEENGIVPPEKLDVLDDMNQPLSHYFINSSHNTYLTVGQLTGMSSVEMYRQVLLTGCRCVELDCWKGRLPDEEPYITHGFTMTTEISFKEVIEAIAESAFKASPYPVILSFENHVDSVKQQAKMAEYCRTIFGEALLIDPLEKYPLLRGHPLPSPHDLMGKILIKNKKNHREPPNGGSVRRKEGEQSPANNECPTTNNEENQVTSNSEDEQSPANNECPTTNNKGNQVKSKTEGEQSPANNECPTTNNEENQVMSKTEEYVAEKMTKESEPRKSFGGDGDSEEEDEEELESKKNSDEGTAGSEVKATEAMSNLVNYVEPVKFRNFQVSEFRKKYFEMSSFVESKGLDLLRNMPVEFVEYNKNQMSRIYPKGTRVDSSNYMPQLFWNVGCQMVALNFQTLDLPMQLNMGVFEYNGHSGYLLKPEFMRRVDKHFDPFTESIVDGIVANTVKIRVISGQFLSDKKVSVYVEVLMLGLPADTTRRYRTKPSNGNSLDPVWEETFEFNKVVLPTLASLRVAVFEENGKFIGHRILPVSAIRPGYHYISLKNELNQPLLLPSLLVYTEAQDYIPNEHQDYAEALTNPIKHISQLDKRNDQLAVLIDPEELPKQDDPSQADNEPSDKDNKPPDGPVPSPLNPAPSRSLADIPDAYPVAKVPVPVAPNPKEELVASTMREVHILTIEELMEQKNYVKLLKKQEKDFKELRKKNLKKVLNLSKEQKSQSSQRQSDTQRRRSQIEKNLKRSVKKNESQDPVKQELSALEQELEKQRQEQLQELLKLRQELHLLEKEKKMAQQAEALEKLKEIAKECHAVQIKKLQETCEKEKKELLKILDRKRQNSIIEAKNNKDKAEKELNEINRKHIQDSVASVRTLEGAQLRRKDKVVAEHKTILQCIDARLPEMRSQLEEEMAEEYKRLPEELCQHLKLELQNKDGSDPPSNCSSPTYPSTPDQSIWSRSRDNSKTSLEDSSSPATTPVRSEAKISIS